MKQGSYPVYSVDMKIFTLMHRFRFYSLESKGAAIKFLGSLKTSLFGWRAADQQELMGCVHELKLLLCTKQY